MKLFIRLFRLPNLFIIILTMYLLKYCIVRPILSQFAIESVFGDINFLLLTLSVVLITAAGYVINDYFDIKADFVNKPEKVMVDTKISQKMSFTIYFVLNFLALGVSSYLAMNNSQIELIIIFVLVIGLLWFYSTTYKKQLIIGNLIVSALTAAVPIMVLLFEMPPVYKAYNYYIIKNEIVFEPVKYYILGYSIFAFILTLIREIVKDAEDFEGDYLDNRNTLPIVFGSRITKGTIIGLSTIFIVVLVYSYFSWLHMNLIPLLYIAGTIVLPMVIINYYIVKAKEKSHYHLASSMLKFVMVSGVLFLLIIKSNL